MSELCESITMCEGCERVPVPVYLVERGRHRGMRICATCLVEEGIHMAGEDAAALLGADLPDTNDRGKQEVSSEIKDQALTCVDCGRSFTWTARDQHVNASQASPHASALCQACLQAKKFKQRTQEGKSGPWGRR